MHLQMLRNEAPVSFAAQKSERRTDLKPLRQSPISNGVGRQPLRSEHIIPEGILGQHTAPATPATAMADTNISKSDGYIQKLYLLDNQIADRNRTV